MKQCHPEAGQTAPSEVATGEVYAEIADRLGGFRPGLRLDDHVKCLLIEADTVLDGFTFKAKNADTLMTTLRLCRKEGQKAFAEAKIENQARWANQTHWPLKMSFQSTHGTGFREIWRGPVLSDRPLSMRDYQMDASFSGNFGNSVTLPDLSSLHCAIAADYCNIHIDQMGFVVEGVDEEIALTPDFFEHIVNELLFKTNLKGMAPRWMGGVFDRLSLIYPNSENNYSRMGPRISQVPLLRDLDRLPGIGRMVGSVPLPGLSIDVIKGQRYKLTVNATCGIHGDCSTTLSLGGDWD